MLSGKGNFNFHIRGEVIIVTDLNDNQLMCDDKIVVLKYATPDIVLLFHNIKGIICENGGSTCHLSMLALEMSVPCVVGVSGATSLHNGAIVTVESNNGVGEVNEINSL